MRFTIEGIHIGVILYLLSILLTTARKTEDLEARIADLEGKNNQGYTP